MCCVHVRWNVNASSGLHRGLNSGMGWMRQITFCQRAKQASETILVVCIDLIRSTRMVHALAPRAEPKQLGRPSDKISETGGRCKCSCCAAAVLRAMQSVCCRLWPAWVEALRLASVGLQLSRRMHRAPAAPLIERGSKRVYARVEETLHSSQCAMRVVCAKCADVGLPRCRLSTIWRVAVPVLHPVMRARWPH